MGGPRNKLQVCRGHCDGQHPRPQAVLCGMGLDMPVFNFDSVGSRISVDMARKECLLWSQLAGNLTDHLALGRGHENYFGGYNYFFLV